MLAPMRATLFTEAARIPFTATRKTTRLAVAETAWDSWNRTRSANLDTPISSSTSLPWRKSISKPLYIAPTRWRRTCAPETKAIPPGLFASMPRLGLGFAKNTLPTPSAPYACLTNFSGSSKAAKNPTRERDMAWRWLMTYPVQNQVWTQYFEDVLIYTDYRTNRNQYSALETARYLLQHPEMDSDALVHAKRILDWVTRFFATDSVTMAGLHEKGLQWGAEVLSEQVNDMDKMSSHTARYASVRALWYEVTGDLDSKERAFRSFNWATYSSREDGLVKTSLDEATGYWFSDGYGDYLHHFQQGMASVPEWAPPKESHLLGSTSVVRAIHYGDHKIDYLTFDKASREVLRLRNMPTVVRAGAEFLPRVNSLNECTQGYTVEAIASSGFAVRIKHEHSGDIRIRFENAEGTHP
jgi:hypothetical protein